MTRANTEADLWARVDKTGDCWVWTGALNDSGYGLMRWGGPKVLVHRLAYELTYGVIPSGLDIDHLCRVRHCVNPEHLEPVTRRENILRGEAQAARNARKTHCPAGHPFDEVNTYVSPPGRRHCRECMRRRDRERYHRQARRI